MSRNLHGKNVPAHIVKPGPGVLYTLLIVGLICLFLFSDQPFEEEYQDVRFHRRQLAQTRQDGGRASAAAKKHEPIAFDPLVAEVERRREDRGWEREYWSHQYKVWANQAQHYVSNPNIGNHPAPEQIYKESPPAAMEAESQPNPWANLDNDNSNYTDFDQLDGDYLGEDYLNSEQFNITHRLEVLFPQIDTDPQDGFVSLGELQHWHEMSALKETHHTTDREMELHDLNGDGLVTFAEYLPDLPKANDAEENDMEAGGAGWWREQFNNADGDKDGALNRGEFHEFLHPEDSKVEKIHQWVVGQELKARSEAHAANLTWEDFHHNVFDVIRQYGTEETTPELAHLDPYRDMEERKRILSKARFQELDTNKDGFITEDEAEPFVSMLRPGEQFYARQQAEQSISQADQNLDGKLGLDEMLAHPYVFYNAAYDHGSHSYSHDEFR